jgi:hypothetical protein
MPRRTEDSGIDDATQWRGAQRAQSVWVMFQTLGFVGLLGDRFVGGGWIWLSLSLLGIGVGLPAMVTYFVLRGRAQRSTLQDEPPSPVGSRFAARVVAGLVLSACMLFLLTRADRDVDLAIFGVGLAAGLVMVAAAIRDHRMSVR